MAKPTLIVSLDFELFWGMQDVCKLSDYKDNILGGRQAIPLLLELFKKHGIHATWATVGFLFAENKNDILRFAPDELPTYDSDVLSTYRCLNDIGDNESSDPFFYAPSLIQLINKTEGQEVASHTFSHYYCRESGQSPKQFLKDMQAAKNIAQHHGYLVDTVVLPRNQTEEEYTKVLAELDFIAYRDEENDWIHEKVKFRPLMRLLRLADVYFPLTGQGGYIPANENGIINLPGSRMYKPYFKYLPFMERLKIRRIKKQMYHAAKNGLTFHLWWHPHNIGIKTDYHLKQLEEIFEYYDELKEQFGMQSLNMREAAQSVLDR